jgi:iron complex transport system substrate-binding protein
VSGAEGRIVSLLASGTELVCALGAGDRLVGRSHECDHPAWVKRLPAVSRPTFDIGGSSRDIDQRVRERLRAKLPLYEVDEAAIVALAPDVLITQTHCEVCAVSPADLAHGAAAPALVRKQVIALRTGTLEAILGGFVDVARVLGLEAAGENLVAGLREKMAAVARATAGLPRVSVACLEWLDPVFPMGNWGPELVELAGGTNLLGTPGAHSSQTAWENVLQADPEVLVIAACGFDVARTLAEMPLMAARPRWSELRAVRSGRVYVADGNLYFNRSGPCLFDSPAILAEMLHPAQVPGAHQGHAWVRWP